MRELYQRILDAWNGGSGQEFAAPFASDGVVIGFDGSRYEGRGQIESELSAIFGDHETGKYYGKVRSVRDLGDGGAVLIADVGMVPPGAADMATPLTSRQTLVAERRGDDWAVVLFQTTPAQLHGRPEELEALTEELRGEMPAGGA